MQTSQEQKDLLILNNLHQFGKAFSSQKLSQTIEKTCNALVKSIYFNVMNPLLNAPL